MTDRSFPELQDCGKKLPYLVQKVFFSAGLRAEQEDLLDHAVKVRSVGLDESVQIPFFLRDKLEQNLPRTLDDFELTVRLHLAHEVDHLCHDDANLVPFVIQFCQGWVS